MKLNGKAIKYKILFTDFDGTLFSKNKSISPTDVRILQQLGQKGVTRVIATGRSYFSIRKVLPENFPIDFVILSSGAGIMEWPGKRLLKTFSFSAGLSAAITAFLVKHGIPFFRQDPLPHNHGGYYYLNHTQNADFKRRLNLYRKYLKPVEKVPDHRPASQFIIMEQEEESIRELFGSLLSQIHLIKATSPLDHQTIWLEIFPEAVSKANGAQWLLDRLGILGKESLAIGNDFNDLDLLHWADGAFVMPDAPLQLRKLFPVLTLKDGSILSPLFSSDLP
jgi:Cof subfamily protein (haloacid dehalogenase superfamily)